MRQPKKKCPFCGGDAQVYDKHGHGDQWRVECVNRFADGGSVCPVNMRTHNSDTRDGALDLWDTRKEES